MNVQVLYDSKFGNTERIAQAIAKVLHATRVVRATDVEALDLSGCELLVIGGPTQVHGMSPALKELDGKIRAEEVSGLPVAVFDTRAHMARLLSGSAAHVVARHLKQKGATLVAEPESFFVTGTEGPLEDGEVERAERWAVGIQDALTYKYKVTTADAW
ncbi:MAG: hypothetical protein OJF49_002735 [Ktedonobacterales bacterium]|jgi:flavodoxin|nr:MAG: hypothetical protein OJF49_002735 [Ktedonobacterales bacterium]